MDFLTRRLRRRLGRVRPLSIQPYAGHGTQERLWIGGRVLEKQELPKAAADAPILSNVKAMYRRFATHEAAGVRVRVRVAGTETEVLSDEEGYFKADIVPKAFAVEAETLVWAALDLPEHAGSLTRGRIYLPPSDAEFGVISDVDDTILQTGAASKWRMIRTTLTGNALTRMPFEGVAAFYRALRRGAHGTSHNPFFYVSSSPWNLYDLLVQFVDLQALPSGPLFLRDLGIDRQTFISSGHHTHKTETIERILSTHPTLRFILIGDSGQEDPEIYRDVAVGNKGRIGCIYIRDVSPPARDEAVRTIARALASEAVPMILVRDSVAAAEHAAQHGFMQADALADVRADRAKDA